MNGTRIENDEYRPILLKTAHTLQYVNQQATVLPVRANEKIEL